MSKTKTDLINRPGGRFAKLELPLGMNLTVQSKIRNNTDRSSQSLNKHVHLYRTDEVY